LAKAFEVSSRPAAALGPKQGMPTMASASASPASTALRPQLALRRHSGIARRDHKPGEQRRLGDFPRQRMLAPARSDQQDVHIARLCHDSTRTPIFAFRWR
jgi:hypothetical protein